MWTEYSGGTPTPVPYPPGLQASRGSLTTSKHMQEGAVESGSTMDKKRPALV